MKIFNKDISFGDFETNIAYFREYQKYAYGIIAGVIVLQALFVWVGPRVSEYRQKTEVLNQYKKVLKEKQAKAMDRENIEKELDRLRLLLKEKEKLFFSESEFSEFAIEALPKMAKSYGLSVLSINYGKPSNVKTMINMPLELKVAGNFLGMVNFFYDLENAAKIIKIEDFMFKKSNAKSSDLMAVLSLSLYRLKK
jgi:Tfp pilus assembly protein PilO